MKVLQFAKSQKKKSKTRHNNANKLNSKKRWRKLSALTEVRKLPGEKYIMKEST